MKKKPTKSNKKNPDSKRKPAKPAVKRFTRAKGKLTGLAFICADAKSELVILAPDAPSLRHHWKTVGKGKPLDLKKCERLTVGK